MAARNCQIITDVAISLAYLNSCLPRFQQNCLLLLELEPFNDEKADFFDEIVETMQKNPILYSFLSHEFRSQSRKAFKKLGLSSKVQNIVLLISISLKTNIS